MRDREVVDKERAGGNERGKTRKKKMEGRRERKRVRWRERERRKERQRGIDKWEKGESF
jgi:hypothetical protein